MGLVSNGFPSFKLSLSVDSFHKLARETVSHDITQSQRSHLPIHSFALSEFVRAFTIQLFTMTMFILHHCGCAQIESENWEVSETIFVGSAERVLSIFFAMLTLRRPKHSDMSARSLFFTSHIARFSDIWYFLLVTTFLHSLHVLYISFSRRRSTQQLRDSRRSALKVRNLARRQWSPIHRCCGSRAITKCDTRK